MFKNLSWIISIAQFIIFVPILLNFLLRTKDGSRQRFFILAACYFSFNLLNFSLNYFLSVEDWILNVCTYLSGLFITIAIIMYIIKEFEIIELVIATKNLIWLGTAVISSSFLTSIFFIGSSEVARMSLIITPIFSALLMIFYVYSEFKKSEVYERLNKIFLYSSYLSLMVIITLPLFIYLRILQDQLYSIVNITFILLAIGYFFKLLEMGKEEHELKITNEIEKNKKSSIEDFNFTTRELETLGWILEGKTVEQIAVIFHIEPSTVYKHVSNIYKKTGCKGLIEVIKKFK